MRPTSIEWPKCPHCKVELNGWGFIPATAVMSPDHFWDAKCPKCSEEFYMRAKIAVTFETEQIP